MQHSPTLSKGIKHVDSGELPLQVSSPYRLKKVALMLIDVVACGNPREAFAWEA